MGRKQPTDVSHILGFGPRAEDNPTTVETGAIEDHGGDRLLPRKVGAETQRQVERELCAGSGDGGSSRVQRALAVRDAGRVSYGGTRQPSGTGIVYQDESPTHTVELNEAGGYRGLIRANHEIQSSDVCVTIGVGGYEVECLRAPATGRGRHRHGNWCLIDHDTGTPAAECNPATVEPASIKGHDEDRLLPREASAEAQGKIQREEVARSRHRRLGRIKGALAIRDAG